MLVGLQGGASNLIFQVRKCLHRRADPVSCTLIGCLIRYEGKLFAIGRPGRHIEGALPPG